LEPKKLLLLAQKVPLVTVRVPPSRFQCHRKSQDLHRLQRCAKKCCW
jgi:hypothetical protein